MSDSAGRKTSAKRKSHAAGKDSGAQKQRKERTRRRIRLMYWGNSSSSSLVYIIPDFSASANFCRIFFAGSRWRQSAFNAASGSRYNIRQLVSGILYSASSFLPPAASLYKQTKPHASHCTTWPASTLPPALSSLQGKSQTSVCEQPFFPGAFGAGNHVSGAINK